MAYNRVDSFDPLGDAGTARTVYQSPASYSATWEHYHGDMGSPEIEMSENPTRGGPVHRASGNSQYSTASTLFSSNTPPGQADIDTQAFLHDPMSRIDHTFTENFYVPYEDHSGRQLRHILVRGSVRFAITVVLCVSYIVVAKIWENRGVQTENQKKLYNTITTGISIAVSLNIASAFKDMALNMRWPILSSWKRNLDEVDLILHADSMIKLAKLAMTARRPGVILACASWLFINLLAQAGVAMLSLTYSWDTDYSAVLQSSSEGEITVTKLDHFYPGFNNDTHFTLQDEEYTAHLYGAQAYYLGTNSTKYMPRAGDIYDDSVAAIWVDYSQNKTEYIFINSPAHTPGNFGQFSMYSDRTINVTYACEAHKVTKNGNGSDTSNSIEVENIGEISISHIVPNNTHFFTSTKQNTTDHNQCGKNNRCTVVEAFESSATHPWYYICNITVGQTINDTRKISQVPDDMALKAGSAIAQTGYMDSTGQEVQIYPPGSDWGIPVNGSDDEMGMSIAKFAMSAIACAAFQNPNTEGIGIVPSGGFALVIGHHYFFYLIIGLIMGCHLLFLTIVAVLANRVMVGPDSPLLLGLLLRPIADKLEGVSAGKINHAYKNATKTTTARYEKARNGRWILAMT